MPALPPSHAQTLSRFHPSPAPWRFLQTVWTAPDRRAQVLGFLPCFLRLRQGSSVSSRLIGQTLANDTLQQNVRPLHVIHAQRDAIAVTEIELGEITIKVIVTAMLVNTLHAA